MASNCGLIVAKYVLCFFNFLFFIVGTVVLCAGIWLAADKSSLISLLKMVEAEHVKEFTQSSLIEHFAYVLIVCGAVMFLMSFLGYCGAIRESRYLLSIYGTILILLLIAQITIAGLAFGYKERTKVETKNLLTSSISKYYSSPERNDAVSLMWDKIMSQLSCCGINDYHDFDQSHSWLDKKGNQTVPVACCKLIDKMQIKPEDSNCPITPHEGNSYYNKGCYDAMVNWINSHRLIIIAVTVVAAIVQILFIFLSFCLCTTISKFRSMRL